MPLRQHIVQSVKRFIQSNVHDVEHCAKGLVGLLVLEQEAVHLLPKVFLEYRGSYLRERLQTSHEPQVIFGEVTKMVHYLFYTLSLVLQLFFDHGSTLSASTSGSLGVSNLAIAGVTDKDQASGSLLATAGVFSCLGKLVTGDVLPELLDEKFTFQTIQRYLPENIRHFKPLFPKASWTRQELQACVQEWLPTIQNAFHSSAAFESIDSGLVFNQIQEKLVTFLNGLEKKDVPFTWSYLTLQLLVKNEGIETLFFSKLFLNTAQAIVQKSLQRLVTGHEQAIDGLITQSSLEETRYGQYLWDTSHTNTQKTGADSKDLMDNKTGTESKDIMDTKSGADSKDKLDTKSGADAKQNVKQSNLFTKQSRLHTPSLAKFINDFEVKIDEIKTDLSFLQQKDKNLGLDQPILDCAKSSFAQVMQEYHGTLAQRFRTLSSLLEQQYSNETLGLIKENSNQTVGGNSSIQSANEKSKSQKQAIIDQCILLGRTAKAIGQLISKHFDDLIPLVVPKTESEQSNKLKLQFLVFHVKTCQLWAKHVIEQRAETLMQDLKAHDWSSLAYVALWENIENETLKLPISPSPFIVAFLSQLCTELNRVFAFDIHPVL